MKLIIQKVDGSVHAYLEDENRFKVNEKDREDLKKISHEVLNLECDLKYFPENSYLTLDLHHLYDFVKSNKILR